jgi:hypothetical protein
VATAHLESLPDFAEERHKQLQRSFSALSALARSTPRCVGALFMGDMNLGEHDLLQFHPANQNNLHLHRVERAKSGRAKCQTCLEKIPLNQLRVSERLPPRGNVGYSTESWHHVECFFARPWEWRSPLQRFPGYLGLSTALQREFRDASKAPPPSTLSLSSVGIPSEWIDAWLSVEGNTEENGATYDGKANGLLNNKYKSRLDRIFVTTPLCVANIEMIGRDPIAEGVWPSDHFGLFCSVSIP